MKRDPARPILAALAVLMLGACGQKGPLYLPGDPSEIQTEIPAEPAEPAPGQDPDGLDDPADNQDDDETDAVDP